MKTRRTSSFTAVRTVGAMLPQDVLERVAEADQSLGGLMAEAYHLTAGDRPSEAISRSWSLLLPAWEAYRSALDSLSEGDPALKLTRERFLLPLFRELGYGQLRTRPAYAIEEHEYPISHSWECAPIHLVGAGVDLDRRSPGVAGAARTSPHSLVQTFLNASNEHLWGFVSNGRLLRILRDNLSLTRQAYVEFDLEAIFDGQLFPDFRLLWLLCHESRVEPGPAEDGGEPRPHSCWLEKWSKVAADEGTRALDTLRDGVERAIEHLGRGFATHPANPSIRDALSSGQFDKQEYYRQLLRIVYRMLFLLVAEARDLLLLPEDAADENRAAARRLYQDNYSIERLRRLVDARVPRTRHVDLWEGLSLVFAKLAGPENTEVVALPALGSFLWSPTSTPSLLGPSQVQDWSKHSKQRSPRPAWIGNRELLAAVESITFIVDRKTGRRPIDYKNLGSEELGSVYESLLELHPRIEPTATDPERVFELRSASGSERKTTGSYYTPDSLVQCLLDSALEPVVDDRLKGKSNEEAEQAILDLKVCDPAVGSGHFLIAAAHRLARRLAAVRTGEQEPPPADTRRALRDVIRRCLYGVDINPMAAELCRVALWIESLDPGKPLSFLDHHIKVGNSLLGTTPTLMAKGIPDDAFKPLEGDNKEVVKYYKSRNRQERKDLASGQRTLLDELRDKFRIKLGNLPETIAALAAEDAETAEDVADQARRYEEAVHSVGYENAKLLADAWCAAFVWRKHDADHPGALKGCPGQWDAITESIYRAIEENPHSVHQWLKDEVRRLAAEYRFFHWHLEFPEVLRWHDKPPVADHLSTKVEAAI